MARHTLTVTVPAGTLPSDPEPGAKRAGRTFNCCNVGRILLEDIVLPVTGILTTETFLVQLELRHGRRTVACRCRFVHPACTMNVLMQHCLVRQAAAHQG